MKTLIIYASKYGSTKDCASYLKNKLEGETTIFDIKDINKDMNLNQYDTIILGSSIYVGQIGKKLKLFITENIDILMKKKVGIYLCCGQADQLEEVINLNFPKELADYAKIIKSFGGEARLDKMKFLDKTVIKAVTKGDFSKFKISETAMDEFVRELTN